jgi:hypothetical protein
MDFIIGITKELIENWFVFSISMVIGLLILAILRKLAEWYMDFKYWVERKFKGGD